MTHVTRRKALTVVAAVPAAAALGGAATLEGPSELAELIRRYWAEVAEVFGKDRSDKEVNALAKATFEKTLRQMIGVPARTAEDAIAALDFFVKDTKDCAIDLESDCGGVYASILRSVRGYIAGRAA